MDINEILSTEGSIHLWLYSSMVVSSPRGDGEPQGRPVAYVSPCAHTPGQAPSAKRTFRVERSSGRETRRRSATARLPLRRDRLGSFRAGTSTKAAMASSCHGHGAAPLPNPTKGRNKHRAAPGPPR